MNNMLCVYNICGIGNRDNTLFYVGALKSILSQSFKNFKLVVSSCCSTDNTINALLKNFSGCLSINEIKDVVPVNCSFNHTVLKSIEKFGPFESYLYIDSGCTFENQCLVFEKLFNFFKTNEYSMLSTRTTTDSGLYIWLRAGMSDNDIDGQTQFLRNYGEIYTIPVGYAVNLHVQLFSHQLLEKYNRLIPDIFAGHCTESVFSFMNAAILKKWGLTTNIIINHYPSIDIASAGFLPSHWEFSTKRPRWDHPFIIDSIINRLSGDYKKYGGGYEQLVPVMPHDPSQFDNNGYSLYPNELQKAIKQSLFLQEDEFNYSYINYEWIE